MTHCHLLLLISLAQNGISTKQVPTILSFIMVSRRKSLCGIICTNVAWRAQLVIFSSINIVIR